MGGEVKWEQKKKDLFNMATLEEGQREPENSQSVFQASGVRAKFRGPRIGTSEHRFVVSGSNH